MRDHPAGSRLAHPVVAALLAATCLSAPLRAPGAQQGQLGALTGLSLAAGIDARTASTEGQGPGLSALVGFDVSRGDGPIAARLTGTFFDRGPARGAGVDPAREGSAVASRYGGVGLDFKYARRGGVVRPYLLAGAGVYRLREERVAREETGPLAPRADGQLLVERTTAALTGGAGLLTRLGPVWGFVEGRYTTFPGGAEVRASYLPVVAGVRF
jgi:hypothetical protein